MERVLYCMAVLLFLSAPSMVRAQASLKRSAAVISSAKLTRQMLWAFALVLAATCGASASSPTQEAIGAQVNALANKSIESANMNNCKDAGKYVGQIGALLESNNINISLFTDDHTAFERAMQARVAQSLSSIIACDIRVSASGSGSASAPSLLATTELMATTDLDCNWELDGKPQGVLKAYRSTAVVAVSSGKHLVQATSTDGQATFRTEVEVEVGQWRVTVEIKLKADPPKRQIGETWTDPSTGLMWTGKDNGGPINWQEAGNYCQNLTLGGYSGWRLPTIDELQGIYDPGIDLPGNIQGVGGRVFSASYHVKGNLNLSGAWQWSSSPGNTPEKAWAFLFSSERGYASSSGKRGSIPCENPLAKGALCVRRSGK